MSLGRVGAQDFETLNQAYEAQDFEALRKIALEQTQEDPGKSENYIWLGIAYRNLERYEEAMATYEKAIDLNPQDATAYYNLGNTYYSLERYEEAIAAYENQGSCPHRRQMSIVKVRLTDT